MTAVKQTKRKTAVKKTADKRKVAVRKPIPPMMITQRKWDRDKVMDYVLTQLASTSKGIKQILETAPHNMPRRQQIQAWIAESEIYQDIHARARESQADILAEEIIEIADDATNDYMMRVNKNGDEEPVLDSEHVQRSRLRIDARKWIASNLSPRKYGNAKADINVNVTMSIEEIAAKMKKERCIN